jgi:hypothetical protein
MVRSKRCRDVQRHCLDMFDVCQGLLPVEQIELFPLFSEHPGKHLNTHCERMLGKSRSRYDNSSLSCFTACGDRDEISLFPFRHSDDLIDVRD